MKISIITVVRNQRAVIANCLHSVLAQTCKNIEYIVIDGASTDGTLEIIRRYQDRIAKIVTEKDAGPYDAMNKGLTLATGDVVGFLHADDVFANEKVIEDVVGVMERQKADSVYGDLMYVSKKRAGRVVRYWEAGPYRRELISRGWMPPHPTFFARRELYEKFGGFDTRFLISSDYELLLRFLYRHKSSVAYIPKILVKMRLGGTSNKNLMHLFQKTREDLKIGKAYGLGWTAVLRKNLSKLPQFFRRPG